MPIQTIAGTSASYALLALDAAGNERNDDPDGVGGRLSERLLAQWRDSAPTDVFLWSHGWQGDLPAARNQYDRWIGAFARSVGDEQEMRVRHPDFAVAHIGVHWPSLPWGDEELGGDASFAPFAGAGAQAMVDVYAQRLGDTPPVRAALAAIFEAARTQADAASLPEAARLAYLQLDQALALGSEGWEAMPAPTACRSIPMPPSPKPPSWAPRSAAPCWAACWHRCGSCPSGI
ncbi:hypothetical protein ACU4GD_11255 [Cupriavidus basilensis]